MMDTLLTMMLLSLNQAIDTGTSPRRGETLLTGAYPFYERLRMCKDGKYLAVGAIEPWFYANLCRLLGREDFIEDQRAEGAVREERFRVFREIFRAKTRDEWVAELMFEDTCVTPVYSMDEVAADPHLPRARLGRRRAGSRTVGTERRLECCSIWLGDPGRDPPFTARRSGRTPGAVLREMGYDESKIDAMAAAGAF